MLFHLALALLSECNALRDVHKPCGLCQLTTWLAVQHDLVDTLMEKCSKYSELTSHQNCRFSPNDNHKTDKTDSVLGIHTLACRMRSMLGHAVFASKMDSKRSLPCLPENETNVTKQRGLHATTPRNDDVSYMV